jgi:hypothetical protein
VLARTYTLTITLWPITTSTANNRGMLAKDAGVISEVAIGPGNGEAGLGGPGQE